MIDTVLKLKRKWFSPKSTIGELYEGADPKSLCYTLEDKLRVNEPKVTGKTCIPPGRYEIVINFSKRFGKSMPLLLNVPGFDGIRFHSGNTDANTEGCILVGSGREPDLIWGGRSVFPKLYTQLEMWCRTGKVFIEVVQEPANGLGMMA